MGLVVDLFWWVLVARLIYLCGLYVWGVAMWMARVVGDDLGRIIERVGGWVCQIIWFGLLGELPGSLLVV